MKLRKIVTIVEEIRNEGGREVSPPARVAVVAAVIENPWAGKGFVEDLAPPGMNWDYIRRLRDAWPRKLVIKGLVTREDALITVENGLDGIVVSNHGGRAEDSGRASIDSLARSMIDLRQFVGEITAKGAVVEN